ncbi:group III truncated hemoglobin [Roseovarius sp. S1116L3]|uniref:group III truncated hemoglobin n=1 Tax=Roseovarius roseus TaxID=3342636 RepID=UPI003728A402
MSDPFNIGKARSERARAQRRQTAEILGIDEAYLTRMVHFFVARVRADRRFSRFYAVEDPEHRARQVDRMISFWKSVALETGDYTGDLIEAHRHLRGVRREDFDRWLALFRATLDETAPTPEAARYLMIRAERVARKLETAILGGCEDTAQPPRHGRGNGQS